MDKVNTYYETFNLTEGMFDESVSFTPYAILDIFQELAGRHAYHLGCGTPYIQAHNIAWILAKQYAEIYKQPKYESSVEAYTFPHKPSNMGGLRETVITQDGEIIARGITLWVMVDLKDFSLTRLGSDIYGLTDYHESYFKKVPKILETDSLDYFDSYKIMPTDLDKYHHMNNAKYANFILNSLHLTGKEIKSFGIQYHNQAKLGDVINLVKDTKDNKIILKGYKDEEPIFTINVERN